MSGGSGRAGVRPDFWHGRRVFITGHTGFKGAWLALWLQALGAVLTGFSRNVPTEPSLCALAAVSDDMEVVWGDVRDHAALAAALEAAQPEIVIHMAAQPLVRRSYDAPRETFETNVIGTVNVLEAVRGCPAVRVVIGVTSDKCYADAGHADGARRVAVDRGAVISTGEDWPGYREDAPMGGADPYSASKGAAELVIDSYRHSFFSAADSPRIASARAGNVIGGGDWAAERLVPDLMRSALAGRSVRIRNPDAVRPWQHVLSPLSGYLLLAQALWEDPHLAGGWNFGPPVEDARPVGWVAGRIAELWPGGIRVEVDRGGHPPEAFVLKLDSSKAREQLGWRPPLSLDDALGATVEWWSQLASGAPMRAVTLRQIESCEPASMVRSA